MHQFYDLRIAEAVTAERRAEFRRANRAARRKAFTKSTSTQENQQP